MTISRRFQLKNYGDIFSNHK